MGRALVALLGAGDAESAAVLTPYNGQVRLIRSILKSKGGDLYTKVGARVSKPARGPGPCMRDTGGWPGAGLRMHCMACRGSG
jgi:hypothetical protein